jgi:DNA-binding MarR family transcriptional regulator
MMDKNSDVSRLLDRLILKELIVKRKCPNDKRAADIEISNNGLELLEAIHANIHELDSMLSKITEQEAKQLSTILDKIRG